MSRSLLVVVAASLVQLACGGGGLAPASLSGKTVTATESAATGNQLPVGTSELVFSSETVGKIDGTDFTYAYTPSLNTGKIKGTLPGSAGFTIDYDLTFTSATAGTFVGTVVTGPDGTDTGTFVIK